MHILIGWNSVLARIQMQDVMVSRVTIYTMADQFPEFSHVFFSFVYSDISYNQENDFKKWKGKPLLLFVFAPHSFRSPVALHRVEHLESFFIC